MKNKLIGISICISALLSADTFVNPLSNSMKAIDNGGAKQAIDAYKDGVGVIVLDNLGLKTQVDNSAMNTLVFKYGESAKINNKSIASEVLSTPSAPINDIILANNMTNNLPNICDDNNINTYYDKMVNGVCTGTLSSALVFESTENNLKNEATFNYKMINSFWSQTGSGLFDKIIDNPLNYTSSDLAVYWAYQNGEDATFEITINEPFRIWRSKNFLETQVTYNYASNLRIFKKDGANWIDVSNKHLTLDPALAKWQLFTSELSPGTYRFKGSDYKYRIDLEWFIEKKI